MKSLPEKDFWNNIKTRLSNYTEEPEDNWDDIAALISPSRYDARKWIELGQDIVSAVVLVLLLLLTFNTTDSIPANMEVTDSSGIDHNKSAGQWPSEGDTLPDQKKGNQESATGREPREIKPETSANETDFVVNDTETDQRSNASISGIKRRNSGNLYPQSGHLASQTSRRQSTGVAANTQTGNNTTSTSTTLYDIENTNSINAGEPMHNATAELSNSAKITNEDSAKNINRTDSISDSRPEKKEEQQQKKRSKKFHPAVYFTLSPSLAYQKIVPVKNDAINVTELKSDGIFASNRMGLAIDGGFQLPLTKTIEVYAGLSYYQQNQSITYKYSTGTVEEIEGHPDEDYIIKPGIKQREFSYAMRNAGISAGFLYRLKTDKLMHKIGAGLQYQKGFLRAGESDTYSNRSSNYFNYQLLYRLELAVNPRTNFYIQPSFTHAIHASESLNEPFTLKPYRAAIGIGMIYRF